MYKIITGKYDPSTASQTIRAHSTVTRGNQLRLEKARCKYDLRKYFFTNRTVNIWNSLPNHVVLAESTNSFKSRLDNHWKTKRLFIIFSLKSRQPEAEARLCIIANIMCIISVFERPL